MALALVWLGTACGDGRGDQPSLGGGAGLSSAGGSASGGGSSNAGAGAGNGSSDAGSGGSAAGLGGSAGGSSPGGGQAGATAGAAGGASVHLDLNDVSFLYPLPSWQDRDQLLSPATEGAHGPLVPRALYEQEAPLLLEPGPNAPDDLYGSLRVVSARIDPCFPADASATPPCRKQLRLVMQPVLEDPASSGATTGDGALHALYDLSDAEWQTLSAELYGLKALAGTGTDHQPLQVHPVLRVQGLAGTYATALRSLILEHASSDTLAEMAFMQLTKKDRSWIFMAKVKTPAGYEQLNIPRVSATSQGASVNFSSEATGDAPHTILIQPPPPNVTILALPDPSSSSDQVSSALHEALRIDNPSAGTNPQTVDCASCHLATRNRRFAERARSVDTSSWPERFEDATFDLSHADEVGDDQSSLRTFGYFGSKSSIADRVINESALVAAQLSR